MFVTERFELTPQTIETVKSMTPEFGFGQFGALVFYRTYSRDKPDGSKESWADVVLRVTRGVFSIRKDWYKKNHIHWDEEFWQHYSHNFAISLFKMEWLAPGRGLWAMGTDFVYERGSMALNNCGFVVISDIGRDIGWLMDCLMCGVGIGFTPERDDDLEVYDNKGTHFYDIPDTREGWVSSVVQQIESYVKPEATRPIFGYTKIRGPNQQIKGFGGLSSGPDPLRELHEKIDRFFEMYLTENWYDSVLLKTDLANATGCCVVSGNVRRSAELCCLPISDPTFLDMKDYERYPYRAEHGWMSNNSAILEFDEDFERLGEIARRVLKNAEPGFINKRNMVLGRIGKSYPVKPDPGIGFNPCGEQVLENYELCTLVETLPTRCKDTAGWLKACEYATFYASTVTLLPTHQARTNAVMLKNRRIGVGIIDVAAWREQVGANKLVRILDEGYNHVRKINRWLADEAGIPEAIRVTTIKPGGTTPKMAGRVSGFNRPNFNYMIRRVNVARDNPICELLNNAGVPHEPNIVSRNTEVYEFPVHMPGRTTGETSVWQQGCDVAFMQRHWSDNAVSNTLNFNPITEKDDIEPLLTYLAPLTKSVSLNPQTDVGCYKQMPEEGITKEEYEARLKTISVIDWSLLKNSPTEPERYCVGDKCEIEPKVAVD